MAFISVSGEPGCRPEDLARLTARKLDCELLTESSLSETIASEFGETPAKAWMDAATSVLARIGTQRHVVVAAVGSEILFTNFPGVLRVHLIASEARRAGEIMVEQRVDRTEAKRLLRQTAGEQAILRRERAGKPSRRARPFDLLLNAESFTPEQMLELVEAAVRLKDVLAMGLLPAGAEAQIQFQVRLRLAKFGLTPSNRAVARKREFGHPSEEIFANLLDFYRVKWEYEPRSFPLQWDKDGKAMEAFTPDFYLPEFDLYVELTTMKQTLVTRKNRKIRLLRAIYPHINIQVFYQKDLQDLVMKYGLAEKGAP